MTTTNATAVKEMLHEIATLVSDLPAREQLDMIVAISNGITKLASDIVTAPDPAELAHDRELKKADDKFNVRQERE